MTKRQITVPPKEEHCVNGRYYRAGETYSAPTAAKGTYIQNATVSSTMGPGLRVNVRDAA